MMIVGLNLVALAVLTVSLTRSRAGSKRQGAVAAIVAALLTTVALAASVFSSGWTMWLGLLGSSVTSICIANAPRFSRRSASSR